MKNSTFLTRKKHLAVRSLQKGVTSIEYAVIAAILAAILSVTYGATDGSSGLGADIKGAFDAIGTKINP